MGIGGIGGYHIGKDDGAIAPYDNSMSRSYSDDPPIHLTPLGQLRLQEVVRRAREGLTYSGFCGITGLSAPLVHKLETAQQKDSVRLSTLFKLTLAPQCGLSVEELVNLCKAESLPLREVQIASDLFPIIDEMPDTEVARLVAYAVQRFVKPNE